MSLIDKIVTVMVRFNYQHAILFKNDCSVLNPIIPVTQKNIQNAIGDRIKCPYCSGMAIVIDENEEIIMYHCDACGEKWFDFKESN